MCLPYDQFYTNQGTIPSHFFSLKKVFPFSPPTSLRFSFLNLVGLSYNECYFTSSTQIYFVRGHTLMSSTKNDQFCDSLPPSAKINNKSIVTQMSDKFQDLPPSPFCVEIIHARSSRMLIVVWLLSNYVGSIYGKSGM